MQNPLTTRLLDKARLLQQTPYLTLTAIHPTLRDKPVPSRHIPVTNQRLLIEAHVALKAANDWGWGAYVGIGYRQRKLSRFQRGGKRDILAMPAVFADVDRPPHQVLPLLKYVMNPTLVISSGGGVHIYWFLDTPTTDMKRTERILKGIAIWLNADATMSNDQIMRIPKSINSKPHLDGARCSVLQETNHEYRLDDFLPYEILATKLPHLPRKLPQRPRPTRTRSRQSYRGKQTLNRSLAAAVLAELERSYGAKYHKDGWYACYCPFGHAQDRYPGDHAYFNPEKGLFHCFGRHGQHLIHSIATQIGIDVNDYGGIYQSDT